MAAFRMHRSSKKLREFIISNDLMVCEWKGIIADAGLKDEAIHTQELRLKVNKYRDRMIEDEIRREKALQI
ncbi:MAG: hypothetical protein ACRDDF_01040 [Aeromonas sp.]